MISCSRCLPKASTKAAHIRENVFTKEEAAKLGLPTTDDINYHGLGEEFFFQIIDGLDNVKEAYRGTKNADNSARRENYFLLVSEFTDKDGNTINVPVYIDEYAQFNRVFIEVNKISTVFGKENFREYINRQIQQKNLVRIKNRSNQTSERSAPIAEGYGKDASNGSIRNLDGIVKENNSADPDSTAKSSTRKGESGRILAVAQQENLMDGLNSSERSVLESFNRAQEELKAQAAEKAKQEILSDLKKEGKERSAEASKAKSRIGILQKQMERTTQKLIDYEAMDSVKSVVEKVRPAVESALLKAYDAAGRKIERLEADIEHRKNEAKKKVNSRKSTEIRNKIKKLISWNALRCARSAPLTEQHPPPPPCKS